ncbi:MAG: lyase family protein, partial [Pseudomonadota bacterium]
LGVIPEISAAAIHRATLEIQIDPGALAQTTGENGVSVPGMVAAFREEMNAPEHAQYLHWGATSQDIIDTGLMLRLRQTLALAETDLEKITRSLADQAEQYADLPMPARTYGQHATPTSWGAVIAGWGTPLMDALDALPALRKSSLLVSLSGAAGTSAALGENAAALRAALAEGLGLEDPECSWHTDRTPLLRIAGWMAQVTATLAAFGQTLIALTGTELGDVTLGAGGASSTMPQKQNPVAPSVLVALSHQMSGLQATLQMASAHQHQRDGAAWFAEWMVMPQIALSCAAALQQTRRILDGLEPDAVRMAAGLEDSLGLIHAEALSFALAGKMPRPEAQSAAKTLCREATRSGTPLAQLTRARYPDLPADLFHPAAQLGQAPALARAFAARARAR